MSDYELLNTPGFDSDYIPPTVTPSVPPDYLIQSGGGISNMHHGHPQGPYSATASRSDVYGQSTPFQQSGFTNPVNGGLYDNYDGTTMAPRTCSECSMLNLPPYAQMPGANIDYPYFGGPQVVYDSGGIKKNSMDDGTLKEGEDYTILEPYDENVGGSSLLGIGSPRIRKNPLLAFILLFLIFFTIDLWIQSGNSLLKKYVLKTDTITTKQLVVGTIVITSILFIYATWVGEPHIFQEQVEKTGIKTT